MPVPGGAARGKIVRSQDHRVADIGRQIFYLEGPGVPVASLGTTVPTGALGNPDSGRDSDPGILLAKGGSGVAETDPAKQQTWVVDLGAYQGKVSLVVNVASECGYTPQYAGLQELYAQMKDRGLVVLGFPCNDFGGQEPGSPAQIRSFCTERYEVTFPMFEKVRTKAGEGQSEVYAVLGEAAGELPSWNFGKYLVGKDGRVLAYFPSGVTPESTELREAIVAALES